jgi:sec-independent protein translocase protein TatA
MFRNPTTDLIIVLVIVLLIFGPKRLPSLGRQLGSGLREFKDSITGNSKDDEDAERPQLERAGALTATETGAARERDSAAAGVAAERTSAEVGAPERRS